MASSTPFVEHDPSISTYKQAIKFSKPPGDHHTPFSHDTIASKKDGLSADADVTLSSGVQRLDINTTTTDTTLPKRTFFSLPPEIRNMVYGYLIPIRVHIYQPDAQTISIKAFNPWRLASIAQKSPPKPWTLISVSRQFRAEIRSVVYPRTHIDIHLQWNYKMKDAYETWIEGLDEGVAGSIRHLRIDDWIEIDRMPDSSVADFEWGYGFFGLRGTDLRYCRQTRGNWEIAWLRYIEFDEFSRLGFMEKTICDMEDHLEIPIAMVGLAQLRLLSRSELEDAFFETQEAYKDSKEELESLSSTNERLSRRLEEAKASRIQLRNDYRQLIKEMQAGNSDVPRQELPEVQSDNQTSTQDTKALKDAKAREVVNTSQFGSDKDSLQEDTSALIPSSRQLDVPSEPFIKLAFHDSRNPPSEDMSHSHMQQFSAHANLEQGSSDSDLSTQQPTTASTFPSPPAPAQSSTQPMPTPISASVPQSATMRPIQSPSSQQTREMVVPPRLEKAPKTHPKPELTNPKPKRMRFKQMTQEDFAEGVKRVEAEQRAKAEAEGTRSGPKKMLW